MEFKEFTEFEDPGKADYDILSSMRKDNGIMYGSPAYYGRKLLDLTGFIEDPTDESLMEDFGITLDEYCHPTKKVIEKVERHLSEKRRHR